MAQQAPYSVFNLILIETRPEQLFPNQIARD